jgi:hypothetical protein
MRCASACLLILQQNIFMPKTNAEKIQDPKQEISISATPKQCSSSSAKSVHLAKAKKQLAAFFKASSYNQAKRQIAISVFTASATSPANERVSSLV